jgi:hypothetical protein
MAIFNVLVIEMLYDEIRPQPAWKGGPTETMDVNRLGGKTG